MRYDAGTHTARAALFMEGAANARTDRERVSFMAHAVIAKGLAELAEKGSSEPVFIFFDPAPPARSRVCSRH